MVNLNLNNSGEIVSSLGAVMVGASALSFLSSNNCPYVCTSSNNKNNCGDNCTTEDCNVNDCTIRCPISRVTRTSLLIGVAGLTLGNSLNLVSLLR